MTRKPYISQHPTGTHWTVHGHGYTITIAEAEWNGRRQQYAAHLKADGYESSCSYFSPAPGRDFDNDLAENAVNLFSIGRGDVDPEFFDDAPGSHFNPKWIAENNWKRDELSIDRETFERRAEARHDRSRRRA